MSRDRAILRFLDHLLADAAGQQTFEAELLDPSSIEQIVLEAEVRGYLIERMPFKQCRLIFHKLDTGPTGYLTNH